MTIFRTVIIFAHRCKSIILNFNFLFCLTGRAFAEETWYCYLCVTFDDSRNNCVSAVCKCILSHIQCACACRTGLAERRAPSWRPNIVTATAIPNYEWRWSYSNKCQWFTRLHSPLRAHPATLHHTPYSILKTRLTRLPTAEMKYSLTILMAVLMARAAHRMGNLIS